jgi:glucosamine--fructose-6-phosphate aminotransferase (isomerizing)
MCGIIGYIGEREAVPILLEGLKRLEYRGYDSAGIVVHDSLRFHWEKSPGKITRLSQGLGSKMMPGSLGVAHTRWATHGAPNRKNAHPHFSCNYEVAVVHNGIIENFQLLKRRLRRSGHLFRSDTDTEVIAHLLEENYKGDPLVAVLKSVKELKGAFALGILFKDRADLMIGVRMGCPLVVGLNSREKFIASDVVALLPFTKDVCVLEDAQIVQIDKSTVKLSDFYGKPLEISVQGICWDVSAAEKGGFPHYMLKEIMEGPEVAAREIAGRIDQKGKRVILEDLSIPEGFVRRCRRVVLAACGTAWHAGLVAKYALEEMAGISVDVGLASEIRYADVPMDHQTLFIAVSQSGETADTLGALNHANASNVPTLAVTNIKGSSIPRKARWQLYMRAGLEIGVAATKTYLSQLICLILLALHFGRIRGHVGQRRLSTILDQMKRLPEYLGSLLSDTSELRMCAEMFKGGYDFMYIGRRYNLATAYEGALKMKEISYLHAEGYGGGEMKHGPLALVDDRLITVAIVVPGRVHEKMLSNMQEIHARGGTIISVAAEGDASVKPLSRYTFWISPTQEIISPILAVVPLQLFAYYTAVGLGRDVDQPRNLAKSVTVE